MKHLCSYLNLLSLLLIYTQDAALTRAAVMGSQLWAVASRILASTPPVAVVALTTAVVVQLRTQLVAKVGAARRLGRAALSDTLPILPPEYTRDIIFAQFMYAVTK